MSKRKEPKPFCRNCYVAQGEDGVTLCDFHATAPELLAALWDIVASGALENSITGPALQARACAAIAKAEGK